MQYEGREGSFRFVKVLYDSCVYAKTNRVDGSQLKKVTLRKKGIFSKNNACVSTSHGICLYYPINIRNLEEGLLFFIDKILWLLQFV